MKFLLAIFWVITLHAITIEPTKVFHSSGGVSDFFVDSDYLYSVGDHGKIDVFELNTTKRIASIALPLLKDFMGDMIEPKIYSIDKLGETLLVVSSGKDGFSNLWSIINGNKPKLIINETKRWMVKKARYLSEDILLLGLLSNELIKYDSNNDRILYTKQLSTSAFSDFELNSEKRRVVATDESGIIRLIDTNTGNILQTFQGQNVDNIYKLDFQNGVIIGAGQDRRASIYHDQGLMSYYKEASFLIYAAGLSPDASLGAYAATIENEIIVFNTTTQKELFTLKGQASTLTKIKFLNNHELITSSDDDKILYWRLP